MSKDFKTPAAAGAARFITVPGQGGPVTAAGQAVTDGGKTITAPVEREESPPHEPPQYYRLNLKLDGELREYLADEAWRNRISITALVNQILTEYRDAHAAQE